MTLNLTTSATYFQKCADMGNPECQYELGFLLNNGLGLPRNPQLVCGLVVCIFSLLRLDWTRSHGAVSSLCMDTPPLGIAQGILNYIFAAEGNNPSAGLALGYRHMYGYGVEANCSQSASYFRMVAAQGFPSSFPLQNLPLVFLNVSILFVVVEMLFPSTFSPVFCRSRCRVPQLEFHPLGLD